jgi:hypothetical protein
MARMLYLIAEEDVGGRRRATREEGKGIYKGYFGNCSMLVTRSPMKRMNMVLSGGVP